MEDIHESGPSDEEKMFKLKLNEAPLDVKDRYYRILLDERTNSAKMHQGKPQPVPLEKQEDLFRIARVASDVDDAVTRARADRDFKNATSKDGRPPIGGAQD
jgi:hypothetical protein